MARLPREPALTGVAVGFALGGLLGLVVGLLANPRTAWFAVLEAGLPAAALGGLVGVAVTLTRLLIATRRQRRSDVALGGGSGPS